MRIVPNTTDWLSMILRVEKQTKHAEDRKFIAVNIDVADMKMILAAVKDPV